ncbi:glycosyltransferase family 9 protein [Acidocella sp.]|uniref:glycosyltransferase family 9 protein n=1 Tax=Acidocella sp. TaxID=50710 RepID=UPI003D020D49
MRVLVIRHGAFGDIVLSFAAFAAIREHHRRDEITLLTTRAYAGLLGASPWFDKIEIDEKPDWWNLPGLLRLKRQLSGFGMVYDLQTSGRSSRYFSLAGRPPWSGIARGCAFPDAANRGTLHSRERLEQQLGLANLPAPLPPPDLSWLSGDISGLRLPPRYVILVPGAAPHRPEKRFPAEKFREIAQSLQHPAVIVGTAGETHLADLIGGIDLTGKTDFFQLASVFRGATLAIGNDTGPMHLAAALGVPCISLFSAASEPARTAPRYPDGGWPVILRAPTLQELPVAQVLAHLP